MTMSYKNTENLAELRVKKLCDLHAEDVNTYIVALVLSKTEPNIFMAKNDTQQKGVINFTITDAKDKIVNCKCWGPREKIEQYNENIQIGDIIDVICPKINNIKIDSKDSQLSRYQPLSTLPITLVLNDGQGLIEKHNFYDLENYKDIKQLWRLSHKPLYTVLNLADVKCSFRNAEAAIIHTDFLVVVGLLRPLRQLKAKDGKMLKCLEVVVFDQSLPDGMIFTIWHQDWIKRALKLWQPFKTILHLIDTKVSFSEFYKGCILSFTSRSLIYENPLGQETQVLIEYAESMQNTKFEILAQQGSSDSLPKADQIQTIMTVRHIYTRVEGPLSDSSDQFTAVLYAMITHINLDMQNFVLSKRCKSCNRLMAWNKTLCETEQCQMALSFNCSEENFEYFFNVNLHLSDQTGTIREVKLTDKTAERILNLTPEKYRLLGENDFEKLKWSFLMNHYEVKLLIKKPSMLRHKLVAIIIDMRAVDIEELSKYILAF